MMASKPLPANATSNGVGGEDATATATTNALNNRSSDTTSLLDSCVDDDEDDDNASVKACDSNSEEYAKYIDKTGRQQYQPTDARIPKPVSANTGIILTNVTPLPPPTATVTPESTARNPKADPSPSTIACRNVSLSPPGMDGLEFDMNQPWERSLLRQLQEPNEGNAPPSRQYELKKTAPIVLSTTKPMMLLGHTESRDYAMEYDIDDTVSLETSSSCPPMNKMQFIHRSPHAPPQPRVVYHIPSSNDDDHNNYPTANYYYQHSSPVATDKLPQMQSSSPHTYNQLPIIIGKHNNHPTAASSLTNGSFMTDDGRDDELMMMMDDNGIVYKKIPAHLPHSGTTRTTQEYLEMEPSMGGGASYGEMIDYNSNAGNEQQHYLNQPNTDHIQPDPGCFCLGYNMLDYIISAAPPTQRPPLNGKKQRLNGVLRPVRLPPVTESVSMMEHMSRLNHNLDNNYDEDIMSEVIDTNVELKSSTSSLLAKKISNVEPEGLYLTPTENYFATGAATAALQQHDNVADDRHYYASTEECNETRRQGVDL